MQFPKRVLNRIESWQIRRFGTSLLSAVFRTPVLLLHTTGRRSGRERSTPLAHHDEGSGRFVIVGGAAGQRRTPDWVVNLRADSRASITHGRRRRPVLVDELTGTERAEMWGSLRRHWPRIERYRRRSGRTVPLFRITVLADDRERRADPSPAPNPDRTGP